MKSVGNERAKRLTARTAKEAALIVMGAPDSRDLFLCGFTTPIAQMPTGSTIQGVRPTKLMTEQISIHV